MTRGVGRVQRSAARDGQVLIGSSRELVDGTRRSNRAMLSRMLARAIEFMPALATLSAIRAWTGFRPATPDKLPLIGAWDADAGALDRRGSRRTRHHDVARDGAMLADLVAGRKPPIDAAPFSPMRVLASAAAH